MATWSSRLILRRGRIVVHEVVALIAGKGEKHFVDVMIKTKNGIRTIVATDGHPFWVDDHGDWVPARDLVMGDDDLLGPDGSDLDVVGVRSHSENCESII